MSNGNVRRNRQQTDQSNEYRTCEKPNPLANPSEAGARVIAPQG